MAAGPHGGGERLDGVGEAPVNEARTEAECRVVRLRLVRRGSRVGQLEGEPIAELRFCGALAGDRVEVRRDLDPVPRAAELGGEQNRRPATPRRDVEDARVGPEPETPPEEGSFSSDVGFWISCVASATTK